MIFRYTGMKDGFPVYSRKIREGWQVCTMQAYKGGQLEQHSKQLAECSGSYEDVFDVVNEWNSLTS